MAKASWKQSASERCSAETTTESQNESTKKPGDRFPHHLLSGSFSEVMLPSVKQWRPPAANHLEHFATDVQAGRATTSPASTQTRGTTSSRINCSSSCYRTDGSEECRSPLLPNTERTQIDKSKLKSAPQELPGRYSSETLNPSDTRNVLRVLTVICCAQVPPYCSSKEFHLSSNNLRTSRASLRLSHLRAITQSDNASALVSS